MKLVWREDRSLGFTREVASLGNLPVSITMGGAGTIGATVYVGTLLGAVVAISPTAEACEAAILKQAMRELNRLDAELASVLR